MGDIERWKLIQSRKVDALPLVVRLDDPAASTASAEVFEVVRADAYQGAVEALENAREFIKSVTAWEGQQDDQEEALDELARILDHAGGRSGPPGVQAVSKEEER